MTTHPLEISEEEFEARFPLLPNHLNPDACWRINDLRGSMFETYGQEFAFVREQDERAVWTLVDADGDLFLLSGIHLVNRLGYLVSAQLIPAELALQVRLEHVADDGN